MYNEYFPKYIHDIEKKAVLGDRNAINSVVALERALRELSEKMINKGTPEAMSEYKKELSELLKNVGL